METQVVKFEYQVDDLLQKAEAISTAFKAQDVAIQNITKVTSFYNRHLGEHVAKIEGVTTAGKQFIASLIDQGRQIKALSDDLYGLEQAFRKLREEEEAQLRAGEQRARYRDLQAKLHLEAQRQNVEGQKALMMDLARARESYEASMVSLQNEELDKRRTTTNQINAIDQAFNNREKNLLTQRVEALRRSEQSINEIFTREENRRLQQQQVVNAAIERNNKQEAKKHHARVDILRNTANEIAALFEKANEETEKAFRKGTADQIVSRLQEQIANNPNLGKATEAELNRASKAQNAINNSIVQGRFSANDYGIALESLKTKGLQPLTVAQQRAQNHIVSFNKSLQGFGKELQSQKGKVEAVTISWQGLVRIFEVQVLHSLIARLINQFEEAIRQSREFSIAVAEIQTISQDAALSTQEWESNILRLSSAFGKTPLDVAAGAYETISNQVAKGAEAFQFLDEALKLSVTTQSTTAQSVNLLTSVLNAYQLEVSKTHEVSSALFKAVDLGRFRIEDLAQSFGHTTVLAKSLGIAYEEVLAAISNLTRKGVSSDEAQTQLSNLILRMVKPTEEMVKLFNEWGVSSGEAAIQTFGFFNVLRKFEEAARAGDRFQEIGKIFQNIRAIRGFEGLSSAIGDLESDFEKITNSTEQYDKAVNIVADSIGKRMQKELQEVDNLLLKLGEDLNESTLNFFDNFGGLSEGIEALILNMRQLISLLPIVIGAFAAWKVAAFVLTVQLDAAGKSLSLLQKTLLLLRAHPILLVAAGVTALAFAFEDAEEKAQRFQSMYEESLEKIRRDQENYNKFYIESLEKQIKHDQKYIDDRFSKLRQATAQQKALGNDLAESIEHAMKAVGENLSKLLDRLGEENREVLDNIRDTARDAQREAENALRDAEKLQENINNRRERTRERQFENKLQDHPLEKQAAIIEQDIGKINDQANATDDLEKQNDLLELMEVRLNKLKDIQQNINKEIEKSKEEREKDLEQAHKIIQDGQAKTPQQRRKLREAIGLVTGDGEANLAKQEEEAKARSLEINKAIEIVNQRILDLDAQRVAQAQALAAEKEAEAAVIIEQVAEQEAAFENLKALLKEASGFDEKFKNAPNKFAAFDELSNKTLEAAQNAGLSREAIVEVQQQLLEQLQLLKAVKLEADNQKILDNINRETEKHKEYADAVNKAREALKGLAEEKEGSESKLKADLRLLSDFFKEGSGPVPGPFGTKEQEGPQIERIKELLKLIKEANAILSNPVADKTGIAELAAKINVQLRNIKANREPGEISLDKIGDRKFEDFINQGNKDGILVQAAKDVERINKKAEAQNKIIKNGEATLAQIANTLEKLKKDFPELFKITEQHLPTTEQQWRNINTAIDANITRINDVRAAYLALDGVVQGVLNRAAAASLIQPPQPAGRALGGLVPQYFAMGGFPGMPRGADTQPVWAQLGEHITNAKSARAYAPLLQAINSTRTQHLSSGGDVTNVGDINVHLHEVGQNVDIRDIGRKLEREIKKGNIRFRR